MQTVETTLSLLRRQAELESAIRQAGRAIRLAAEQELRLVRQQLAEYPEATRAAVEAAHSLGRPLAEVTATEVESWASAASSRFLAGERR